MENKRTTLRRVYWEIIADNLSKAGWSWGCVSAVILAGERSSLLTHIGDNGKRVVVRADKQLKRRVAMVKANLGLAVLATRIGWLG